MILDATRVGLIEQKLAVAERLPVGPHTELMLADVPGLDIAEPGGLAIGGLSRGLHRLGGGVGPLAYPGIGDKLPPECLREARVIFGFVERYFHLFGYPGP